MIELERASSKSCTKDRDFAKLRKHAHWYIPSIEGYPDIGIGTREDNSGYNHVATGRLLCPRRLRDQFDRHNEGFCRSVVVEHRVFKEEDWPTFLYQESGYNPDAEEKGLLRGPFLVYVGHPIICVRTANLL